MPAALPHVLLYVLLCLAPALVLLPVWHLDREPSNEITHEQESAPEDPDEMRAVAA